MFLLVVVLVCRFCNSSGANRCSRADQTHIASDGRRGGHASRRWDHFFILVVLLTAASPLLSQTYAETFAGRVQGGVLYALYNADFSSTGDVLDCGRLTGGAGWNGVAQGVLEFPLSSTYVAVVTESFPAVC